MRASSKPTSPSSTVNTLLQRVFVHARTHRRIALRIDVDQQHTTVLRGKRSGKIDGGGRLADAAFWLAIAMVLIIIVFRRRALPAMADGEAMPALRSMLISAKQIHAEPDQRHARQPNLDAMPRPRRVAGKHALCELRCGDQPHAVKPNTSASTTAMMRA